MTTPDQKVAEFTAEQWERIRAQIRARGMTFEVFLPEAQADRLSAQIAAGVFKDAGEAAFIAFQDMWELDRHPELRQALLKAMTQDELDSGPGGSLEEIEERHLAQLRAYANTEPAK
jgi:Arc/MetJ-type ribon-helix-helix transcriptional regulator